MNDLEEILINEEIIDFKRIRSLIDDIISTYAKGKTESVNNIRELKQKILELSEYAGTTVILYEENENKIRELLDKIDKIENGIYKIEEDIASKDKSYNLINEYFDEIFGIFRKYLPKNTMKCLEEIIIINEEIINFKRIRSLINNFISTYAKGKTESVNNIRELKQKILELSEYAGTTVILYEENENKIRELLDKIDKIENGIYKIEEDIASKDKSYNLIREEYRKILGIFRKYLYEKGEYQKLDVYRQQNRQSPIIYL
jgi:chromosome segregation ATPase